jgi:Na+-translocating ferredoxin:NAD+ oxidoreductase subunit B
MPEQKNIKLIKEECLGELCGKCQEVCKFDAIKILKNSMKINHDKCTRCDQCIKWCPNWALYTNYDDCRNYIFKQSLK